MSQYYKQRKEPLLHLPSRILALTEPAVHLPFDWDRKSIQDTSHGSRSLARPAYTQRYPISTPKELEKSKILVNIDSVFWLHDQCCSKDARLNLSPWGEKDAFLGCHCQGKMMIFLFFFPCRFSVFIMLIILVVIIIFINSSIFILLFQIFGSQR